MKVKLYSAFTNSLGNCRLKSHSVCVSMCACVSVFLCVLCLCLPNAFKYLISLRENIMPLVSNRLRAQEFVSPLSLQTLVVIENLAINKERFSFFS